MEAPLIPKNIWGVGRNYKDHAAEMGAPLPEKPLIFLKSGACYERTDVVTLPNFSKNIHYELELGVFIDQNLQPSQVALALDLTARDLQEQAKKNSQPWTLAKSFKGACPCSPSVPFKSETWWNQLNFDLHIDGSLKQKGEIKNMIFSLPEIIQFIRHHFPVQAGDLILTGTPAGVGPLQVGQNLLANLRQEIRWEPTVTSN